MISVEEKLASFSKTVLEMANKQRDGIMERLQGEIDQQVEMREKTFVQNAREDMEKEILKKIRENNEKVLKTEVSLKRKLFLKRENIINEIFKDVKIRVKDFMDSPQYGEWLKTHAESGIKELGGNNCVIHIMKQDERYKKELEETFGCDVETVDQDFFGGVKIYLKNKCVDYSLELIMEQANNEFLKNTDLSVD